MFAIAFDLNINNLKSHYNDPYNNAIMKSRPCYEGMIFIILKEVCI